MKTPLRVACSAFGNRIYVGRIAKNGLSFTDGKQDVTSDCIKAVIEKVGPGHIETIEVDGVPTYEIEVRKIGGKS